MFGDHFYHATMRKSVAVFGTLFNNLKVARTAADGSILNQIRVPLAYGPKQKFLARLDQETGFDAQMAIKLPRMAFEISGVTLDTTQKLAKRNIISETHASDVTKKKTIKHYTSYDIGMSLYIMAKNQDDGLQIVEQILPTFNPQYTLTIKPFSSEYPTFKEDIPIIIQGLTFADDFEGALEQRRTIIYTLDFEMKVCFYNAINNSDIIRTAKTTFFDMAGGVGGDSDIAIERIDTVPNPTSIIGLADSDFGFTNTITLLSDSA